MNTILGFRFAQMSQWKFSSDFCRRVIPNANKKVESYQDREPRTLCEFTNPLDRKNRLEGNGQEFCLSKIDYL